MNIKQPVNRIENDLNQWRSREERFTNLFPSGIAHSKAFLKEKLNYYHAVAARYKGTFNQEERFALHLLKQERNRIEKQLHPNLLIRLLRGFILPIKQQQVVKQMAKQIAGNEQVLKETLFKTGFGNAINKLEQHLKQGQQAFSIPVSYYINEKERLDFSLSFAKDHNGQYQFESYKAALKNEHKPEESKQQNFNIEQRNTVTATQAYNLLAGRAVQKEHTIEGSRQSAWMQLDFNDKDALGNYRMKEFHGGYGYDLKSILQQLPIKDLNNSEIERMENALKNGSRYAVSISKESKEQKIFIEANPQLKSVNIYDEHLKKVSLSSALGNKTPEPVQRAKKVNLHQETEPERKKSLSIK